MSNKSFAPLGPHRAARKPPSLSLPLQAPSLSVELRKPPRGWAELRESPPGAGLKTLGRRAVRTSAPRGWSKDCCLSPSDQPLGGLSSNSGTMCFGTVVFQSSCFQQLACSERSSLSDGLAIIGHGEAVFQSSCESSPRGWSKDCCLSPSG